MSRPTLSPQNCSKLISYKNRDRLNKKSKN